MNQDELQQIINQLDRIIPKEDAKVFLSEYADDGSNAKIVGNQRGYLRLGVEFLKAAFAQQSTRPGDNRHAIEADLDYLITDDSDLTIGWLERREDIEAREFKQSGKDMLVQWGCLIGFVMLVVLMLIGVRSVIQWVTGG